MKRIELASEWLANWSPTRTTEIADRGCKGLLVRGGPTGVRTFYRWTDARDDATGAVRRKRMKLGHWPTLSLGDARKAVYEARETRHAEVAGTVTVGLLPRRTAGHPGPAGVRVACVVPASFDARARGGFREAPGVRRVAGPRRAPAPRRRSCPRMKVERTVALSGHGTKVSSPRGERAPRFER
jgi:hypothetical protein